MNKLCYYESLTPYKCAGAKEAVRNGRWKIQGPVTVSATWGPVALTGALTSHRRLVGGVCGTRVPLWGAVLPWKVAEMTPGPSFPHSSVGEAMPGCADGRAD